MLQNNDPNKANKSGKKRFMQDMRRQGLTAGITYVVLGALQRSVNNSVMAAVLSLGGVTLASEVLSRKMGGIPLTPLSPEEAAKVADKQEKKRLEKEGKEPVQDEKQDDKEILQNEPQTEQEASTNNMEVFKVFTDKVNYPSFNGLTSFKANDKNIQNEPAENKDKK